MARGWTHVRKLGYPFSASASDSVVAFLSADGTGYLKRDFAFQCTNCSFVLTREVLAVVKFAKDVVKDPLSVADRQRYNNGVYMACVL